MRGEQVIQRATALTIKCAYCGAREGDRCFDLTTGSLIENQPAHNLRMRESGAL